MNHKDIVIKIGEEEINFKHIEYEKVNSINLNLKGKEITVSFIPVICNNYINISNILDEQ